MHAGEETLYKWIELCKATGTECSTQMASNLHVPL